MPFSTIKGGPVKTGSGTVFLKTIFVYVWIIFIFFIQTQRNNFFSNYITDNREGRFDLTTFTIHFIPANSRHMHDAELHRSTSNIYHMDLSH